jgi:uncharacterized protein YecE (DUF72 family)
MPQNAERGKLFSGTSNVVLPVPNKTFYPELHRGKTRLGYYATLFNSVEVNSSFYKIPRAKTIEKWCSEVSDGFRFSFKVPKSISHCADFQFDPAEVVRFLQSIQPAVNHRGCLLLQFPPSRTTHPLGLHRLLQELQSDWPLAVEFRHRSWYTDSTYEILKQYGAALVLHDLPASATPLDIPRGKFRYVRFHGPGGGYRGSYDDQFLAEYASYIREWVDDKQDVYLYFNNTAGAAVHNLMDLKAEIRT